MSDLVPFLVIGVTTGSLYGLAGLGLVLTYRTAGIFNFAHGTLAATAAYVFYTMHFSWGWPWPVAAFVAVLVFGPLAGVVLERLSRALTTGRTAATIVGTVGLLLFVQGFLYWSYGPRQRPFRDFLPTGTVMTISGVTVNWAQLINVGVGLISFAALYAFLRRARLGKAMRAVVADPNLLALTGTDAARVRIAAWVIGSSFAALTGILIAPTLSLNAGLLSALVVQAFGAVAIGRFSNLPLTYAGGLVIGVSAAVATKFLAGKAVLGGIPAVIPFLVLIVVMLVTPAGRLPRGAERQEGTRPERRRSSKRLTAPVYTVAAALLVAVPSLVGPRLPVYTTALVFVILFLSLSLLTQVSGQISLAHAAFAGVGAATFSRFTVDGGYPWLVGLLAAGVVTGLIGVVLALPSMRLSGLYLALATFGFGLLMENVVFHTSILFGNEADGLRGLHPQFGPISSSSDTAYYYVVLAAVVASCAVLVALRRARLGRFLRALADSPTALTTVGVGVNVTRVIVFATSAFFAGVAGALFIVQAGRVSSVTFGSINSLLYLAALTVAGVFGGFVIPAFVAGALLFILPSYLTSMTLEVQSMLFGGTAVIAALMTSGRLNDIADRLGRQLDTAISGSDERRWRTPIAARTPAPTAGPEPSALAR